MIIIDLNIATNTTLKNKELIDLYSDIPEALENNYNFHLRFNFKPKKSSPILPNIATEFRNSPEEEILRLAKEGLTNRLDNFILKKLHNQFIKLGLFMRIG